VQTCGGRHQNHLGSLRNTSAHNLDLEALTRDTSSDIGLLANSRGHACCHPQVHGVDGWLTWGPWEGTQTACDKPEWCSLAPRPPLWPDLHPERSLTFAPAGGPFAQHIPTLPPPMMRLTLPAWVFPKLSPQSEGSLSPILTSLLCFSPPRKTILATGPPALGPLRVCVLGRDGASQAGEKR